MCGRFALFMEMLEMIEEERVRFRFLGGVLNVIAGREGEEGDHRGQFSGEVRSSTPTKSEAEARVIAAFWAWVSIWLCLLDAIVELDGWWWAEVDFDGGFLFSLTGPRGRPPLWVHDIVLRRGHRGRVELPSMLCRMRGAGAL